MSICWRTFLLLGAALGSTVAACAQSGNPADPFNPPDMALLSQGRYVFQRNCAICHGTRGDGRGEMGLTVVPRPRNFATGIFKYRSTPSGTLPTDADLERTVREGIPGSAMPIFGGTLSARDIHAVVQYVKDFSPKWNHRASFATALALPPIPNWFGDATQFKQRAENGRQTFTVACAACHGADARGNGPAVTPQFLDVWGHPARPADLTLPALHSGRELTDVYKVLATGINGTPMASFLESTTELQRWELVAYIASLRQGAPASAAAVAGK